MENKTHSPAPSPLPQSTFHPQAPGIFNIHTSYLLHLSIPLPPALAAISALTSALPIHPLHTISETLALLSHLSSTLLSSLKSPIPASAGTDFLQRWLVTTLQRQRQPSSGSLHTSIAHSTKSGEAEAEAEADFQPTLATITSAGRDFVAAGLSARTRLATYGRRLIREDSTVIVPCESAVVDALLQDAAEAGVRFRVVFVASRASSSSTTIARGSKRKTPRAVSRSSLRENGIPIATIPPTALAHTLSSLLHLPQTSQTSQLHPKSLMILAGADALLSNGGILAPLGTQQAAVVARAMGVPFYAVGERFRCVRWAGFTGSEGREGVRFDEGGNEGVRFHEGGKEGARFDEGGKEGVRFDEGREEDSVEENEEGEEGEKMDVTRPDLVTGIVTENGVVGPAAIAEEAIRIWF